MVNTHSRCVSLRDRLQLISNVARIAGVGLIALAMTVATESASAAQRSDVAKNASAGSGSSALACEPSWLSTFGGRPGLSSYFGNPADVRTMCMFDDGLGGGPALFVGGHFELAGGVVANGLARWDGSSWTALLPGLQSVVEDLIVFDDGAGAGPALYVVGALTLTPSSFTGVARWNGTTLQPLLHHSLSSARCAQIYTPPGGGVPQLYVGLDGFPGILSWDGSTWNSVGGGVTWASWEGPGDIHSVIISLAVHDSGAGPELYACGGAIAFGAVVVNRLAKWNGVTWSAVANGLPERARALASFDDGTGAKLYVGGPSQAGSDLPSSYLAAWDGASWSAVGAGVDGVVEALEVRDDGSGAGPRLFVGGSFNHAGGAPTNRLAAWDGSTWSQFDGDLSGAVYDCDVFDIGAGPELLIGGAFEFDGDVRIGCLTRRSAGSWQQFGAGLPEDVLAWAEHDDGTGGGSQLFVGGRFDSPSSAFPKRVARWTGTTWGTVGEGFDDQVDDLAVFDDGLGGGPSLYAAGRFASSGSVPLNRLARWDGVAWSDVAGGLNDDAYVLATFNDGSGPALYCGGVFTAAGGVPASRIAKWDGASWSALGAGLGGAPFAMKVHDDGNGAGPALYVAGTFVQAAGIVVNRIARWDGASWSGLGSGFTGGEVRALEVFDDGLGGGPQLYAAGRFISAGGAAANRIARWDGSSWSPLGSGLNINNAQSLTTYDDGAGGGLQLYVGGSFWIAGGVTTGSIARWNGSAWSSLNGIQLHMQSVLALGQFDNGSGPCLLAAGSFEASPAREGYVALWGGCNACAAPTAYCTAGTTTNGCAASMSGLGLPSASATSGFSLLCSGVEGDKFGIMFYGLSGPNAAVWAPGSTSLLCVKSPVQRLPSMNSGGTAGLCDGAFLTDWLAYLATHPNALGAPLAAGSSVWAQSWYRDPPAPSSTQLSDALSWTMCP